MFGEFIKERRIAKGIGLREFCKRMEIDASNWSKVERGLLAPPQDENKLRKIARLLDIKIGSPLWKEMKDKANIDAGIIPEDILSDEKVLNSLPIFFRTIRSEKPTSLGAGDCASAAVGIIAAAASSARLVILLMSIAFRSRNTESVGEITDAHVVIIAARAAHIARVVLPRTAAQHTLPAVRQFSRGAVVRRALIVPHPAIGDPLGNASGHVVQSKRIRPERPDLDRLIGIRIGPATLACEEAYCDAPVAQALRSEGCAGCDSYATADNRDCRGSAARSSGCRPRSV